MTKKHPTHLEDFQVGQRYLSSPVSVSKDEIIEFASRFDPQKHHLDEAFAATTIFKGLSASGWHTTALSMRMLVDCLGPEGGFAGAGVDEIRWPTPVRPGDVLQMELEIIECRRSKTRPDRGVVRTRMVTRNQNGDIVLTCDSAMMANTRNPA